MELTKEEEELITRMRSEKGQRRKFIIDLAEYFVEAAKLTTADEFEKLLFTKLFDPLKPEIAKWSKCDISDNSDIKTKKDESLNIDANTVLATELVKGLTKLVEAFSDD